MKHRKFVKQIMATGQSRNMAEALATICHCSGEPYAEALERYARLKREHGTWWSYYFLTTLPRKPQGGAKA